jgi:outer membrane protein assembly factor BamB
MFRVLPLVLMFAVQALADDLPIQLGAIPTQATAWQVTSADLDADGVPELLYAGYDGELYCLDGATSAVRWQADIGGFCFCLTTSDLDGDGRPEVLATSASLMLYVFSPDGEPLWTFGVDAPLHAVAAGELLDGGGVQVVCGGHDMRIYFLDIEGALMKDIPVQVAPNIPVINNLAVGDVTGDGRSDLCMTNAFGIVRLIDPRTEETIWNSRDYSRRFMRDMLLWDHDGDGALEALVSSEVVELLDGDGTVLWSAPAGRGMRGYTMAELGVMDLEGDGVEEVAVLRGPRITVLDADGAELGQSTCDFSYFTDLASLPGSPASLLLGSVAGADRNLYRLDYGQGDEDQFAAFEHSHGYIGQINGTLEQIREQVLAAEPNADMPDKVYHIWVTGGSPPAKSCDWLVDTPRRFSDAYPYENLRFVNFIQYREPGYTGQGREQTPEELLSIARKLEAGGALHVLAVAHGIDPFMSVEMVESWLRAAPTTCRGIMMHENSSFVNHHEDAPADFQAAMETFVDEYMLPVMDLCVDHDRRFYLMEKQGWWAALPADAHWADRIFAEKYLPIITPMVEESNSRCPELNFIARVGMWRAGLVNEWGLNVIDDQLRASKLYEYTPCDAHATLRHYLAYVAAGATDLKLGKLGYHFWARDGGERYGLMTGEVANRPYGQLCFDTFMHMLGKGLIVAPEPDEVVGISPVALRMNQPDEGFWLSMRMRDFPSIAPESAGGLFTGCDWGFVRPHEWYALALLMKVPRYAHQFIPENPYGLPVLVPSWTPEENLGWASQVMDTDGVHLLRDGETLTAEEAAPVLADAFRQGAGELPFVAADCYWMARRTGQDVYRVLLVDPGYLDPAQRDVALTVNTGRIASARDVLSGEELVGDGEALTVHVAAGAFRLIDLKLTP